MEGLNKSGAATQFIEQKITKQVTIASGAVGEITISIPQQAKAFLKGYGYTWATSNEFRLICGNQSFPMRTDQEGSSTIPVIYGNPFPVTSGDIKLHITNNDTVSHDYTVVFYVLCDRIINTPSVGGELILSTGSSTGTSSNVVIMNSTLTSAANVTTKGLEVDTQSPATLLCGSTSTTSAAATALAASTTCKKVTIQVDDGSPNVLIGNATYQTIELVATQSISLEIDNLSKIYIKRVTTDATVNYIGS